jgi:hydroxymethylglutaryl-CoA lyase
MADCADVVSHALSISHLQVSVLVPNLRYAQVAFDAGVHALTVPVSVSEPHSLANIRMTHDEIIEEVRAIVALRDARYPGTHVEVGLATAFGCTIQGAVPEDDVIGIARRVADCGVDAVHPADTVGFASPTHVRRLIPRLRAELAERCDAVHLHDTRGQGLANVVAALDVGIRTFDASHGGLGGCPYAPGATGNIVTEDLVFLLESMGFRTGVDLERLIEARSVLADGLPGEQLVGHVADAGLPKGFVPATAAA